MSRSSGIPEIRGAWARDKTSAWFKFSGLNTSNEEPSVSSTAELGMSKATASLLEFWDKLPNNRISKMGALDFLGEIDSSDLKDDVIIYDVQNISQSYLIKFFGQNIISIIDRDLTGEILQKCLPPDIWKQIAPAYEICIDWRSPVFFYSESNTDKSPYRRMDRLLLPFTSGTHTVTELFTLVRFRDPVDVAAAYGLDQSASAQP